MKGIVKTNGVLSDNSEGKSAKKQPSSEDKTAELRGPGRTLDQREETAVTLPQTRRKTDIQHAVLLKGLHRFRSLKGCQRPDCRGNEGKYVI